MATTSTTLNDPILRPDEVTEHAATRALPVWQRGLLLALLPELALGLLLVGAYRQHLHERMSEHDDRERGFSTVEWVLIVSIVVAMATTVGLVILNKVKAKANGITTDTPAG